MPENYSLSLQIVWYTVKMREEWVGLEYTFENCSINIFQDALKPKFEHLVFMFWREDASKRREAIGIKIQGNKALNVDVH